MSAHPCPVCQSTVERRTVVTMGHHHKGPHVDALLALAERCGATVLRLPAEGEGLCPDAQSHHQPGHPMRVPYAGRDPVEAWHFEKRWLSEDAR